ncbi:acyltransferase family protein [Paraburkholderia dinghuensis]|uniref:Acyltransferase n=1 Tax=Paraburkholderia dinghuensis TaxID=2305225 RepID=A0A3N6MUA7_9BURK|nr:acyltransferase [Paraburkholderia dinghuensis]RQH05495.1 acyltransferase [Paraburkholderia dinghuensis]
MRTAHQTKLYGLQHLRFFAAFAVLAHHILEEASGSPLAHVAPALQRVGACGVDIFFVISGLVMWHTTGGFSSQTSARRFISRRLTRIIPPYWTYLAFVVALSCSGIAFRHVQLGATGIGESLLLLPPTTSAGLIVGVSWTLVYELYFYLVCAAVLCLPWQRYRVASIVALIVSVPIALKMVGADAQAQYYGSPLVNEFLFGVFLGSLSIWLPKPGPRMRWAVLMASIALFWWAAVASPDEATFGLRPSFRWWAWGLPAALLVSAYVHTEDKGRRIGRALTVLGDASYVLYLTHGLWMIVFARAIKSGAFHKPLSLYLAASCVAVLAVVFALGIHLYLEKPTLAWLEGKRSRIRQPVLT